jgi:hypothetical protein
LRIPRNGSEAADGDLADFGDAVEVPVDVNDAELVVDCGLGDEKVGDGGAVPHAVVVDEVALELQGAVQDVRRGGDCLEGGVELRLKLVVMPCRPGGVQLFEFAERADVQLARQLSELRADPLVAGTGRGALVQYPAGYRHISPGAGGEAPQGALGAAE